MHRSIACLALLALLLLAVPCSAQDERWFVSADYLGWWIKGNKVPALVTTSTTGTPRATPE